MQGNLRELSVADLIQHTCQDRKSALLNLWHNGEQADIYFRNGQVIHAASGLRLGEDVVYQVLTWDDGSFALENLPISVDETPATIQRSWSALLLEGARRLDEGRVPAAQFDISYQANESEVKRMAQQIEEVLKGLGNEVNGYLASAVIGTDGISIAHDMHGGKAGIDAIGAQTALLIKLVDTSTAKLNAGSLEDSLLTTENAYVLVRYLTGKSYFLAIVADRRNASLGNLRLMSRVYSERVTKAIPR